MPQATKARRGEDDLSPPPRSSEEPLLKLESPMLFLIGEKDESSPLESLRELSHKMASCDIRAETFQDANQEFKATLHSRGPAVSVLRRLGGCVLDFVSAIEDDTLSACQLRRLADIPSQIAQGDQDVEMEEASGQVPSPQPQPALKSTESPTAANTTDPESSVPPSRIPAPAITLPPPQPAPLPTTSPQAPPASHLSHNSQSAPQRVEPVASSHTALSQQTSGTSLPAHAPITLTPAGVHNGQQAQGSALLGAQMLHAQARQVQVSEASQHPAPPGDPSSEFSA